MNNIVGLQRPKPSTWAFMSTCILLLTACGNPEGAPSSAESLLPVEAEADSSLNPNTNASRSDTDLSPDTEPSPDAGTQTADIPLALISYVDLLEHVKSLQGKIVVVDIWSTSCIPCMREFPNLVALSKKHGQNVACVSLNLDYLGLPNKPPEKYLGKVRAFLTKQKAQLSNFISTDTDTFILEEFELGSLPAILIYDVSGNLAHKLTDSNTGDDGLTYEGDVFPKVEQLLGTN